jgi:hypothetical protein
MDSAEWNDEMAALAQRWAAWMDTPFPDGWRGVNVNGCEVTLIDADMAALTKSAVTHRPLGRDAANRLSQLLEELRSALPSITGDGRAYFEELAEIAEAAVRLSQARTGG